MAMAMPGPATAAAAAACVCTMNMDAWQHQQLAVAVAACSSSRAVHDGLIETGAGAVLWACVGQKALSLVQYMNDHAAAAEQQWLPGRLRCSYQHWGVVCEFRLGFV